MQSKSYLAIKNGVSTNLQVMVRSLQHGVLLVQQVYNHWVHQRY